MFEKCNKYAKTIRDGIDTAEMEFKPLKDFCGKKVNVDGFFFTNGKYGKQVVVVGNGYLINMPGRATGEFEDILIDNELYNGLMDGKMAIKNIKIKDTRNGSTVVYEYCDR